MTSDVLTADDIFHCKQCGDCCLGYGGTYVTETDIAAIARHIGTDPETFVRDFCRMSGRRPVLAQKKNGYCIFFDELCTIHPVKPAMCRAWPFIEAVLTAPENWEIMAGSCPGIRTDISNQDLLRIVKAEIARRKEKTE